MRRLRPTCAHCAYWVADNASGAAVSGHCHRLPPSVVIAPETGNIVQKFPTTDHHQWCGEWSDDDSRLVAAVKRAVLETARRP